MAWMGAPSSILPIASNSVISESLTVLVQGGSVSCGLRSSSRWAAVMAKRNATSSPSCACATAWRSETKACSAGEGS